MNITLNITAPLVNFGRDQLKPNSLTRRIGTIAAPAIAAAGLSATLQLTLGYSALLLGTVVIIQSILHARKSLSSFLVMDFPARPDISNPDLALLENFINSVQGLGASDYGIARQRKRYHEDFENKYSKTPFQAQDIVRMLPTIKEAFTCMFNFPKMKKKSSGSPVYFLIGIKKLLNSDFSYSQRIKNIALEYLAACQQEQSDLISFMNNILALDLKDPEATAKLQGYLKDLDKDYINEARLILFYNEEFENKLTLCREFLKNGDKTVKEDFRVLYLKLMCGIYALKASILHRNKWGSICPIDVSRDDLNLKLLREEMIGLRRDKPGQEEALMSENIKKNLESIL